MQRLRTRVAIAGFLIAALAGIAILLFRPLRKVEIGEAPRYPGRHAGERMHGNPAPGNLTNGGVRVRVTHKASKRPIPGVSISFHGRNARVDSEDGISGIDGFLCRQLPPGEYRVKAHWEAIAESEEEPFIIKAGTQSEVEISLDTYPLVILRGTVRTQEGKAVGKARVILTYNRDEKPPAIVDDLLGGDGSLLTFCDDEGRYEFRKVLYPWNYEVYSKMATHVPVRDRQAAFTVPVDTPVFESRLDLLVQELPYVDVTGRLLDPNGAPVRGFKIVVREFFIDGQGKVTGFTETCCITDDEGRYTFRTTHDRIQMVSAHPVYQSPSLEIDVGLKEHAFRTRLVDDIRLAEKQHVVKLRVQNDVGGQRLEGDIQVHEFDGGPQDIVSFGNMSYSVRTDANGETTLRVDPSKRYLLKPDGYDVIRTGGGGASTNRVRGVLVFTSGSGDVTLYVRKP